MSRLQFIQVLISAEPREGNNPSVIPGFLSYFLEFMKMKEDGMIKIKRLIY